MIPSNSLNVKLLNDNAKPPIRSSEDAVGYDLFCCRNYVIKGKSKNSFLY